jgi:predicted nucleic acid-binding protein
VGGLVQWDRLAGVARLGRALARQDAGLVPVILTEVLQGFRFDRDFERARALLTVRGTIDCIIAQTCIAAGVEPLTMDQDFTAIARHAPLRLCPHHE